MEEESQQTLENDLHDAIKDNNVAKVNEIFQNKAFDIEKVKKDMNSLVINTHLEYALCLSDYQVADIILKEMRVDLNKEFERACLHGNIEMAEYLLRRGADVNNKSKTQRNTVLHKLCANSKKKEVLDWLLTIDGVEVDSPNVSGYTPLLAAILEKKMPLDGIKALVVAGANVNNKNLLDYNALDLACFVGRSDVVDYLLTVSDIEIQRKYEEHPVGFKEKYTVPFKLACDNGYMDLAKKLAKDERIGGLTDQDKEIAVKGVIKDSYNKDNFDDNKKFLEEIGADPKEFIFKVKNVDDSFKKFVKEIANSGRNKKNQSKKYRVIRDLDKYLTEYHESFDNAAMFENAAKAFLRIVLQRNVGGFTNTTKSGDKAKELLNSEPYKWLREVMFGSQDLVRYRDLREYVEGKNDEKIFSRWNRGTFFANYDKLEGVNSVMDGKDHIAELDEGITHRLK